MYGKCYYPCLVLLFFFFNDTATTEIYTLSLHDALPIFNAKGALTYTDIAGDPVLYGNLPPCEISMKDVFSSGDSSKKFKIAEGQWYRSEERFSRNAETDIVCRLLLEQKNNGVNSKGLRFMLAFMYI